MKRPPTSSSLVNPGSYRLQLDAKFGISAPLLNGPRLKLDAVGEVFVPVTRSTDPWDSFLTSRAFKLGIVAGF